MLQYGTTRHFTIYLFNGRSDLRPLGLTPLILTASSSARSTPFFFFFFFSTSTFFLSRCCCSAWATPYLSNHGLSIRLNRVRHLGIEEQSLRFNPRQQSTTKRTVLPSTIDYYNDSSCWTDHCQYHLTERRCVHYESQNLKPSNPLVIFANGTQPVEKVFLDDCINSDYWKSIFVSGEVLD